MTVSKSLSKIKAVNSRAQPIKSTAHSLLKVGKWEQESSFMAVPLDDFDLILSIEFFVKAKAVAMPHLCGMLITKMDVWILSM